MSKPVKPADFGSAGERLWDAIVEKYALRSDEVRILEDACREADLIDMIQAGLKDAPLYVKGSMGQQVANPLFAELRQHRSTLAALFGKLKLPDEAGASPRSVGARKAAQARWGKSA